MLQASESVLRWREINNYSQLKKIKSSQDSGHVKQSQWHVDRAGQVCHLLPAELVLSRLTALYFSFSVRCWRLVWLDDAHFAVVAGEWCNCPECFYKAPCAWGAGDPAALPLICNVLAASQAG